MTKKLKRSLICLAAVALLAGCADNHAPVPALDKPQTTKGATEAPPAAPANLPPRPVAINKGVHSGTRDPWLWPFAQNSIWNMPIGSDAVYSYAGLQAPQSGIGVDYERHIKVADSDPVRSILEPSGWETRWPGGHSIAQMRVPDNFVVPDVHPGYTPNECCSFTYSDGSLIQLQPTCRVVAGSNIVGYPRFGESIHGAGTYGTHWGSGLSALGGSIRLGELTGSDPIRHAIKLNIFAHKYCYFDKSTGKGFRWPADRNDSYANDPASNVRYGGANPKLVMGSLLAIWPGYTDPAQLGITTEVGKKLFYALRDYGAYVSDDAAWDHYDLCVENGVQAEVQGKYGINLSDAGGAYYNDMVKLINNLFIVDNNSAAAIGGGGTPCQPLAPAFQ